MERQRIPERRPLSQVRLLDLGELVHLVDDVRADWAFLVRLLVEMADGYHPGPVQVLVGGHDLLPLMLRDVVVLLVVALLPAGGLQIFVLALRLLRQQLGKDVRQTLLHSAIAQF